MNATNPQAVAARIRMAMPSLTPREGRVVTVMVGMTEMNESTSLRDVASDADVSDAMVVKIAKKLGFTGFRQMRAGLIDYNRSDSAALFHELSPDDDTGQIIEKVFRTSVQALEETMAIIDVAAFERAAGLLAGARHRDFYGIGGSAQIARDVAHKFLRIGLRVNVHDDVHMMLMSASLLGTDDVVLAFSHSGNTTAVLEPVELARRNGARVVAITNYADSPLAVAADIALCATARGSALLSENAAARIAQLNVLDALFVAVTNHDPGAARQNLERTMAAVDGKRLR
jgi:DNA-binding MurR/RpiR family transcriptional regulator